MNEIGIITYLTAQRDCPRYLLKMLGCFLEGDEIHLVTEHCDGGEFFQVVSTLSVPFTEDRITFYMWQLLQAVKYLHRHCIGHRDISLENILVSFRHDSPGERVGEFRLMDFGGACQTHSPRTGCLLRYFRSMGKAYYRPPECILPPDPYAEVVPHPTQQPGTVVFARLPTGYVCEVLLPPDITPGRPCTAKVWGYTVPPFDLFSCGVCFFIMTWQTPPWGSARLADPLFKYITSKGDQGVPTLLHSWKKAPLSDAGMRMLIPMIRANPTARPSVDDCLANPWLAAQRGIPVPTHE
jgi:serine/threonine protein kinase